MLWFNFGNNIHSSFFFYHNMTIYQEDIMDWEWDTQMKCNPGSYTSVMTEQTDVKIEFILIF